jgi:hypothetical protein
MSYNDYAGHMLKTAELLLDAKNSNWATRNRAVSTAYYAVFHTLAFFIARSTLPDKDKYPEYSDQFETEFRKLKHNTFKFAISTQIKGNSSLKNIFESCKLLYIARINADYRIPLRTNITQDECNNHVKMARETVDLIRKLKQNDKDLLTQEFLKTK